MNFDDEKLLNIEGYEAMAQAYSSFLKEKGFIIVKVDDKDIKELVDKTMDLLSKIKVCLFRLGGRFNTSKLYSLTDRQTKKLGIMFDKKSTSISHFNFEDKTKCFFRYLSLEFELTKNLIALKEQSNFEQEILRILNDRLSLLHLIFSD